MAKKVNNMSPEIMFFIVFNVCSYNSPIIQIFLEKREIWDGVLKIRAYPRIVYLRVNNLDDIKSQSSN